MFSGVTQGKFGIVDLVTVYLSANREEPLNFRRKSRRANLACERIGVQQ